MFAWLGIVGGFIRAYALWIAVAGLLLTVTLYVHSAEKAKGKAAVLTYQITEQAKKFKETQKNQLEKYDQCLEINASNESQVAEILERAVDAEFRLAEARGAAQAAVDKLSDLEIQMRGEHDQICRRLSDPLPVDFIKRVRG